MKQNDYFLNRLTNPEFTNIDFGLVGLNTDNTSLESKDKYENLEYVKNNPLFLTEGKFDQLKFDDFYNDTAVGFNQLSLIDTSKAIGNSFKHYKGDIFADPLTRNVLPEWVMTKTATNPDRQLISAWGSNARSNPTYSSREIGLSLLSWDYENQKWIESPNEKGFFGNLFETKVLATYDKDGEYINPVTGLKEFHRKGDRKINENGTYYYETLGNRDVYGKEVLSNFDVITLDGSNYNKYDFFDSDDIEKSTTGSLVRNIVKVAPAFIPGIAPWYIGTRVLFEVEDLFTKLAKMGTDSFGMDIPALSAIEGFNKSMNLSTSDHSMQKMWTIENLLNMSADVFTLLAELRWIFENAPVLFGNKLLKGEKEREAFKEAFRANRANLLKNSYNLGRMDSEELLRTHGALMASAVSESNQALEQALKEGYKIGEKLSKLYMTGITVADSFGEAKNEGATGLEAALFTLGYAMGEYGILNTLLGEWILPELRLERQRFKAIINALHNVKPSETDSIIKKGNWVKRAINAGRQWLKGDMMNGTGKRFALHSVANALGEGFEEVSEEALQDFAKTIYNGILDLRGKDNFLRQTWRDEKGKFNIENTFNDYLLNFVGGFIGGGIGNALPNFRAAQKIGKYDSSLAAFLELMYYIREGHAEDIKKVASDMIFADPNCSFDIVDGHFKEGTKSNNQNKTAIENFSKYVDKLLLLCELERDVKDDRGIRWDLINRDFRFQAILNSKSLSQYLLDYHAVVTSLVGLQMELEQEMNKKSSDSSKLTETQEAKITELQEKINTAREELKQYTDGTMSISAIKDGLFEMEYGLSEGYMINSLPDFITMAERKKGHSGNLDDVSQEDVEKYKAEWESYLNSEQKNLIHERRLLFDYYNEKLNGKLKSHLSQYLNDLGDKFTSKFELEIFEGHQIDDETRTLNINDISGRFDESSLSSLRLNRYLSVNDNDANYSKRVILADVLFNIINNNSSNLDEDTRKSLELLAVDYQSFKLYGLNVEGLFSRSDNPDKESKRELLLNNIIDHFGLLTISTNESKLKTEILNRFEDSFKDIIRRLLGYTLILIPNIKESPYIKSSTRQYLKDVINQFMPENIALQYINAIDSVKYTPIQELVDEFLLILGDKNIKFSKLIELLEDRAFEQSANGALEQFGYDDTFEEALNRAEDLLHLLSAHLAAGRTDDIKYETPFGYNWTVNDLIKDSDLITYDVNTYNILALDIQRMLSEIAFYKSIVKNNTNQLLSLLPRIATKRLFDVIESMHKVLPNDINIEDNKWVGYKEFQDEISNVEEILNNIRNVNIYNDENLQSLKESLHHLFNAIYNFFLANKERTQEEFMQLFYNDELTNESLAIKFFGSFSDDFSLTESNNVKLITIFSLFAAAGSLSFSSFEKIYSDLMSTEENFVHSEGLFNLLFHEVAHLTSNDLWEKLAYVYDAYTDKITELNVFGKDSSFDVSPTAKRATLLALSYKRQFLAEGVAGVGKSTSNLMLLLKILQLSKGNLTDNIYIVHRTMQDAIRMRDLLIELTGLDESHFKVFDHNSYFDHISSERPKATLKNSILSFDDEVVKEKFTRNEDTREIDYNITEFNLENKPSLVIIDESTMCNDLDLRLHEKYLKKINRKSISLGDYHLSTLQGEVKYEGTSYVLSSHRNNFWTTFSLVLSFRTNNKLNTNSQNSVLSLNDLFVKYLNDGNGYAEIVNGEIGDASDISVIAENFGDYILNSRKEKYLYELEYNENDSGIYGVKIASMEYNPNGMSFKDSVDLMLKTLNDGEYITYIYQNEESQEYKYLKSLNAGLKIKFVYLSALGREGKYYIIEVPTLELAYVDKDDDASQLVFDQNQRDLIAYARDLYTNLSRAQQGTLIISNGQDLLLPSESIKHDAINLFHLTRSAKVTANIKIANIIKEIIKDIGDIQEITIEYEIEKKKLQSSSDVNIKDELPVEDLEKEADKILNETENDETEHTVSSIISLADAIELKNGNKDKIKRLRDKAKEISERTGDSSLESDDENIEGETFPNTWDNQSDKDKINGVMYSFNTYKLGLSLEEKGYYSLLRVNSFNSEQVDITELIQNAKELQKGELTDDKFKEWRMKLSLSKISTVGLLGYILYTLSNLDNWEIKDDNIYFSNDLINSIINEYNKLVYSLLHGKNDNSLELSCRIAFKNSNFANRLNVTNIFGILPQNSLEKVLERNHLIIALLGEELNGKFNTYIEVPLYSYPNPISMLESFGVRHDWLSYKRNNKHADIRQWINNNCQNLPMLVYLNRIFMCNADLIIPLKNKQGGICSSILEIIDGLNSEYTGIYVISLDKGTTNEFAEDDYSYNQEPQFLDEMIKDGTNIYIKKLAYALHDDLVINGKILIPKGKQFVFMSLDPMIENEYLTFEDILKLYIEQETNDGKSNNKNHDIRVCYINAPSIDAKNLANYILKNLLEKGIKTTPIWNNTGAYKILAKILESDEVYESVLGTIENLTLDDKEKIKVLRNIISEILKQVNNGAELSKILTTKKQDVNDDIKKVFNKLKGYRKGFDNAWIGTILRRELFKLLKGNDLLLTKPKYNEEKFVEVLTELLSDKENKNKIFYPILVKKNSNGNPLMETISVSGKNILYFTLAVDFDSDDGKIRILNNSGSEDVNDGRILVSGKLLSTSIIRDITPFVSIGSLLPSVTVTSDYFKNNIDISDATNDYKKHPRIGEPAINKLSTYNINDVIVVYNPATKQYYVLDGTNFKVYQKKKQGNKMVLIYVDTIEKENVNLDIQNAFNNTDNITESTLTFFVEKPSVLEIKKCKNFEEFKKAIDYITSLGNEIDINNLGIDKDNFVSDIIKQDGITEEDINKYGEIFTSITGYTLFIKDNSVLATNLEFVFAKSGNEVIRYSGDDANLHMETINESTTSLENAEKPDTPLMQEQNLSNFLQGLLENTDFKEYLIKSGDTNIERFTTLSLQEEFTEKELDTIENILIDYDNELINKEYNLILSAMDKNIC